MINEFVFELEEIKKLNLSEHEKKQWYSTICEIVEENEKCESSTTGLCPLEDGYHTVLVRKNGKIYKEARKCKKNVIKDNYIYRTFPDKWLNRGLNGVTFKDGWHSEANRYFYKYLKKQLQENNLNDSYYVFGNNNSGKTFYAVCFANELAKRGKKICYVRVNEIEKYFKDLFDKEYGEEKKELIELMNAADYLILDDIDNSIIGFSLNEILKVIDERFENGKPIFYTSNTSLSDFERNLSRNTSFKGNPKTFINKIKKTLGVCNAEATDSILKQPYSENTKNKNVVYFNEQF